MFVRRQGHLTDWIMHFVTVLLSICLFDYACAFNIDVATKLIHRYDVGTKFGYAVDLYSDRSAHWVLVGAPQAQTRQPNVRRGGAVYKCSTVSQACYEIKFDERGASTALNGSVSLPIDSKDDQWFGASVAASRNGDLVVACAPRYTFFYSTFDKVEPVGTCFTARDGFSPETVREHSPCRGTKWGYHRHGFCMAGFSAAVGSDGETLFLGAPGAYYWQGALATQHLDAENGNGNGNGEPMITRESGAKYDDQYLGYAMATGELDGRDGSDVAVGVPRGSDLRGMVAIYDSNNQNIKNISGEQIGSYFGAAIAISDLDNDGLEDLIVGAPLFTQQLVIRGVGQAADTHEWPVQDGGVGASSHGTTQSGGYEAGKVYVFWQKGDHYFYQEDFSAILGKKDWARFGHAVAAVGDLNGDEINDFIVGAPYDSEDGRGAVHVFNGNAERRFDKPSQIIYGEDIRENVKTFGFSLAGGVDVDGNDYPDVVVGAYASDRAILMKTRPVVSVSGTVSLSPDAVDLNVPGTAWSLLTICMDYSGKGAPENLYLRLAIELDAAQSPENRRAHFRLSDTTRYVIENVQLRRGPMDCSQQLNITVKEGIRDKLSPIVVNVTYSVNEGRFGGGQLSPIKNALLPPYWSTELRIHNDCGPDQQCIPDLNLLAVSSKEFLSRGVSERVNLTVTISNAALDAHQAKFYVYAPRGVNWVGTFAEESAYRVHCTPPNATGNGDYPPFGRRGTPPPADKEKEVSKLECDIGNPFKRGSELVMQVEYQVAENLPVGTQELVFKLEVNSTLPDDVATRGDNKAELRIPLESNIKLIIKSIATPDYHAFRKDDDRSANLDLVGLTNPTLIGPYVSHIYSVTNDPSSATKISSAKLDVFFPHYTQTNDYLLYILHDIITEGNIRCRVVQQENINTLRWVVPSVPVSQGQLTTAWPQRRPRQAPSGTAGSKDDPELGVGGSPSSQNDRTSLSSAFSNFVTNVKEGVKNLMPSWKAVKELTMDCSQMHCTQWTCEIFDLERQDSATVTVNSTLFLKTILKEGVPKATISSMAVAEVTKVPYQVPKGEQMPVEAKTATTVVQRLSRDYVARGIPTWIIIVAILTGLTLLILLILLCWRIGFFKRKRPPRGQAKLRPSEAAPAQGQYSTYSPATQEYGTSYRQEPPYGRQL